MTSNIDPRHGDGRETSPSLREEDTCKQSATRKEHPKFTAVPPLPPFAQRRGTRAQRAGGCPNFTPTTPQKPSSHAIPANHPSFPQAIRPSRKPSVIPADAGTQRKTKHTISTRNIKPPHHRSTHSHNIKPHHSAQSPKQHNNVSPLPRAIPLPLPRGRLRGGPRVRATRRPWGAAPPKQPTLFFTENTVNNTPLIPHILVNHPPFAPRRGTRAQRAGGCPKFTAAPTPLSLRPTRRGGSRTAPTTPHRRSTPSHNNVSPLPRAISLPLPGGD